MFNNNFIINRTSINLFNLNFSFQYTIKHITYYVYFIKKNLI